jgi:hypothetical protein
MTWSGTTVTVVVDGVDVLPFVPVPVIGLCVSTTVSEKPSATDPVVAAGAVNVGLATVALESVTAGPEVWVHAYESAWFWVWVPEPFNVTVERPAAFWAAPATATGRDGSELPYAASATVADEPAPVPVAVTWSWNRGQFALVADTGVVVPLVHWDVVGAAPLDGTLNVGATALLEESDVVRPETCDHA